jgi:hypothetical protein
MLLTATGPVCTDDYIKSIFDLVRPYRDFQTFVQQLKDAVLWQFGVSFLAEIWVRVSKQ